MAENPYAYCREEASHSPTHEIIFSTVDKPKLLSQVNKALVHLIVLATLVEVKR